MSRSLAAAALAITLGAGGCAHGRGTPQEPLVAEVVFRGVSAVDADALGDVLATRGPASRPGVWGIVLKERQRFDPDALATDVQRIRAFYRDRGYYDTTVEDPVVEEAGRGLVRVVFRVKEGPPTRVSKLEVDGLDVAPEAARRLARLPLQVGDVFTVGAYDATRDAIASALHDTGWATGEVAQSAVVLPERSAAEVRYEVKAGARYRVGPVFVGRVAGISPGRIQEQVAAVLRTGDWWDESKLAAAQRRVFDLGVFGAVRVTHAEPDPRTGTIPVVVELRQAKYQTVRAGPGLAIDATRWDAEGQVGWQHRNFLGDLRRVGVDLRAGYAWVPTPWAVRKEGPVASLTADFSQPGALSRWLDLSARAQAERGIQDAYDYWAERLRLAIPVRLVSRLSLVPSANVEVYQLSNTAVDFVPTASVPAGASTAPVLENCRGNVCLLAYLEQLVAWDARDDAVNTRRGYYVGIAVQEGVDVYGYGYRYLRLQPEVRAFYPLGPRSVLAFRTRVGALVPVSEKGLPPLVARFSAGGPASMRGYYTNRLSPMVLQKGDWVPVGGNGAADGSLELRVTLGASFGIAVFLDAAGVAAPSSLPTEYQTALDPTRLQWASGLGIRYRTPFGPLRADLGVRLPETLSGPFHTWFPKEPYNDHREPIIAIQLALGEAF